MELEEPRFEFKPATDPRPKLPEPIPVLIEAVDDLHAPIPTCDLQQMHRLYRDILEFLVIDAGPHLIYQADNFAIHFDQPTTGRTDYRPFRVIVKSLTTAERKLVEAEIDYARQKGVTPGTDILALIDPDGNYLEIREHREVG